MVARLDAGRITKYDELRSAAIGTPLVRMAGPDRNGNVILAKLESEQEHGGHYDRVYPELFYEQEAMGRKPARTIVLETSTGNAGISAAWAGSCLGYETHLGVPACIDEARKKAIREQGGIVHEVEGDYVNAFGEFIPKFLAEHPGAVFLDHSRGRSERNRVRNNETTLRSLEGIADEAMIQVKEVVPEHSFIDAYIAGVGNGSSLLGPGRRFRQAGKTLVYGAEPFSSAVLFELLQPGAYERMFGIRYGSMPVHDVYGLSYPGFVFPHIINSRGLVESSLLVADAEMLRIAGQMLGESHLGNAAERCLGEARCLPRWDAVWDALNTGLSAQGHAPVGKSSALGFAAALELSKKVRNRTILFLCYDRMERYDVAVADLAPFTPSSHPQGYVCAAPAPR